MATTLNGFIACVIADVIGFILLEQIVSGHLVTLEKETLEGEREGKKISHISSI